MKNQTPKLLIVDDDKRLRELLAKFLKDNGFQVACAENAAVAEGMLQQETYDCMVLDVMMPGESGMEFARRMKLTLPILMLTALGDAEDRIKGLEAGAEDYLPKPFEPRELVLRLQKLIARANLSLAPQVDNQSINLGDKSYNLQAKILTHQGEALYLTSAELDLLHVFAHSPKEPLSRYDLAERAGVSLSPRTVDVQITRLRKKLEEDPSKPKYLRTIRHKGYALWPD
jgi:two component transcriptional regulator, winged helix family